MIWARLFLTCVIFAVSGAAIAVGIRFSMMRKKQIEDTLAEIKARFEPGPESEPGPAPEPEPKPMTKREQKAAARDLQKLLRDLEN